MGVLVPDVPHFAKVHVFPHYEDFVTYVTCLSRGCVAHNGKSDGFFFFTLYTLFKKTGQYQIHFPHFPRQKPRMNTSFLCNRCEEEEGFSFLQSAWRSFPSLSGWASRDGNDLGFSSDCEHNVTPRTHTHTHKRRILQATSSQTVPSDRRGYTFSSHKHNHTFTGFLARSTFFKWG